MSNSSWVSNGTNVAYEPKEKNTGEVITSFSTTAPGGVPNSSYAPSTYVLAASGAWIAQTVATAASEVRRPSVYTELTGNPSPYFIATNTNLVYDADANHITTYGAFELAGLQVQNDASFTYTVFQTKAQTWTSCTLNISRNYASTQWTSGTEARFYLSTDSGVNWTLLLTDDYDSDPITVAIFSHTLSTVNPSSLSAYQVKVEIDAFPSSAFNSVGVLYLQLYDIWIEGIYAVSGGSGTVTSITTTGANGVTISGGSTQTITTSGTFALALGAITPTSIATGTGSFTGDVEFASSIKSPNASNSPIVIAPDGTGDVHLNADSVRIGDNNADATIATRGTGDLIITTNEGSVVEGIVRLYDGANGNITLTPNGSGQVKVGTDQVVTLVASQTLTNKTLSTSSTWNGNAIGVAYGGTGSTTLTSGSYLLGAGTSAVTLKTPTQVTADLDTFTYTVGITAGKKGLVPAAPAVGASVVYLDQTGAWTAPNGSGTTTNALTITSPLTGTSFNGSSAVSIGIPVATTSANGYLSSADWTTFNNKGSGTVTSIGSTTLTIGGTSAVPTANLTSGIVTAGTTGSASLIPVVTVDTYGRVTTITTAANPQGTVTSVAATVPSLLSISGSPITTSGTLAITYSGTALPVANGGTGLTTLTAGYIPYGAGTSAFGSSANLFWDSANSRLGIGTASPSQKLNIYSSAGTPTKLYVQSDLNFAGMYAGTANSNRGAAIELVGHTDSVNSDSFKIEHANDVAAQALVFYYASPTTAYGSLSYSEKMRLDSSGNVGIGATTSSGLLTLKNNPSGSAENVLIGLQQNGASTGTIGKLSYQQSDDTMRLYNSSSFAGSALILGTNNTERVRIDVSGNVILNNGSSSSGTSTATPKNIRFNNDYSSGYTDASLKLYLFNSGATIQGFTSGPSYDLQYHSSGSVTLGKHVWYLDNAEKMRLDATGLGIGTASPSQKLTLGGQTGASATPLALQFSADWSDGYVASKSKIYLYNNGGSGVWGFAVGPDNDIQYHSGGATNTNGQHKWYSGNVEFMRLNASGNLGIGTSSPTNKLHIAAAGLDISGGIAVDGSTMQGIRLQNTVNTNSSLGIWFGTNNVHWCGISGQRTDYTTTWGTDLRFYTHEDATSNLTYSTERMRITTTQVKATVPFIGNSGTKGFGGITTTTSTSTPTGGSSGDHYYIY